MRTSQNNIKYPVPNRKRKNPCERNGVQLGCHICESLRSMAKNCPEKNDTYYTQDVALYQPDSHHPKLLKTLASESWNAAVLDSGATNTVAGESWLNCYMSSLSESEKQKV